SHNFHLSLTYWLAGVYVPLCSFRLGKPSAKQWPYRKYARGSGRSLSMNSHSARTIKSCCLWLIAFVLFSSALSDISHAQQSVGVTVPAGFEVKLFADDELAHDIYSLTVDARGRVVVAGRGYVRTLIDDNGDGKADRYQQFSDIPANGAMGMFFFGNDLICTG